MGHFIYIFFFNDTATTDIYTYLHTLSLHDALPISDAIGAALFDRVAGNALLEHGFALCGIRAGEQRGDGGTRFCALSAFRLNAFARVAHFPRAFLMENLSAYDARDQHNKDRKGGVMGKRGLVRLDDGGVRRIKK